MKMNRKKSEKEETCRTVNMIRFIRHFSCIWVAVFVFSVAFTSCKKDDNPEVLSIGEQQGLMTAGSGGVVTYKVTTKNIGNGSYDVTVANLPAAVIVKGPIVITQGNGALSLEGGVAVVESVTENLTLTISGANSKNFTLTISPKEIRTVAVSKRNGELEEGVPGEVNFDVTTVNVAAGQYTPTVANLPQGVTVKSNMIIDSNGKGTLTLVGGASTRKGTYADLTLTIDGVTSDAFSLIINEDQSLGTGTAEDPFRVRSVADLQKVGSGTDGWTLAMHYRQVANIDLAGINWTPIEHAGAVASVQTVAFQLTGTYDGNGNTIFNLTINNQHDVQQDGSHLGLFATVGGNTGVIKNLRMENVDITSKSGQWVGAVAGNNMSGLIENCCAINVKITAVNAASGIVGRNGIWIFNNPNYTHGGKVRNCFVSGGTITALPNTTRPEGEAGGIVGFSASSNDIQCLVENCYVDNVTITGASPGGISGRNGRGSSETPTSPSSSLIQYCYVTGSVIAKAPSTSSTTYVGGIAGSNALNCIVRNCVALNKSVTTSDITYGPANYQVGRIIGNQLAIAFFKNYARSTGMTYTDKDGNITVTPNATGNDGANAASSDYGSAGWYTNAADWEVAGWDFTSVWEMGASLPILKGFQGVTQNPTVK
jgi:hypothetical protein